MTVKKITPVLFADAIEPSIDFWVNRMGFQKIMDVPEGDKLAFAMLQKGSLELMYQTYTSADKDDANIAKLARKGPTFLYIEVDNLDQTIATVQGVPLLMERRTTFYGADEISVQDPAGHVFTFAQFGAAAA
jgi:uncharacterized glyoxalase superfamily protein PhnB